MFFGDIWNYSIYGDYPHPEDCESEEQIVVEIKCECGQNKVDREEDRQPQFHSRYCEIYKKYEEK